jgi:hypothetical protein
MTRFLGPLFGSVFRTHFWDPLLRPFLEPAFGLTFGPHFLGLRRRYSAGQPNTPEVTISVAGFLLQKCLQIRAQSPSKNEAPQLEKLRFR